jgi:septum site-determining protein MinC
MSTTPDLGPQAKSDREAHPTDAPLGAPKDVPGATLDSPAPAVGGSNGTHATPPTSGNEAVPPVGGSNGHHGLGPLADPSLADLSLADPSLADPGDGYKALHGAIKIRGRPGGLAVEVGEGEWGDLLHQLEDRLHAAEGFFRGGRVVLDVGARPLAEEHLRAVSHLFAAHAMHLGVVRATDARTLEAATAVGVAVSDGADDLDLPEPVTPSKATPSPTAPASTAKPPAVKPTAAPPVVAPRAEPPLEPLPRPLHFVHRGSLRSGQVLRKTESIVIIGDVNPGAQVISGGDIMVWGRLRGVAHAGADGNRRAVVTAIDFVPTQLRIANLTAIAPEPKKGRGLMFWKKEAARRPEIARVVEGRIVVEPWDETKPNSQGMWRK